ncbi:MAG: hypothetical protein NTZ17_17165 [Phycisphaerae bacterium]|nr:hypothetical protein [Phycisphaerae bacterium]
MTTFSFQRVGTWLRPQRFTDEEYVAHVRKWQKRVKNARIFLLLGGLGLPATLLINAESVLHATRLMESDAADWFARGFDFGITMGFGLCIGLAWLLLALMGMLGERTKRLMLEFHDDLRNREQGRTADGKQ